jgi:hypothetical protein
VPADAASVALNVTATNTTGPGYLTIFPCGQTAPTASNVNYTGAGQCTVSLPVAAGCSTAVRSWKSCGSSAIQ